MYVCICNAVTDSMLKSLITNEQLSSVDAIQAHIKVADQCKKCYETIDKLLKE